MRPKWLPLHRTSESDHCFGPVTAGSEEHQASCCALCSIYPDCKQWVVSFDQPPRCWLKGELGVGVPSPTRGIGTVAPAYIARGCLLSESDTAGWVFVGLFVVGLASYVGGGVTMGRVVLKRGGGGAGWGLHCCCPAAEGTPALRALG